MLDVEHCLDDDRKTHPTILLIEDDKSVRQLLDTVLRYFKFNVIAAADSEDALALFEQNIFDLVLMDVQMPVLDGPELFVLFKAIDPKVVCCFLSGHTGKYTVQQLCQLGAAGFISKPFNIDDLRAMILDAIEKQQGEMCLISE